MFRPITSESVAARAIWADTAARAAVVDDAARDVDVVAVRALRADDGNAAVRADDVPRMTGVMAAERDTADVVVAAPRTAGTAAVRADVVPDTAERDVVDRFSDEPRAETSREFTTFPVCDVTVAVRDCVLIPRDALLVAAAPDTDVAELTRPAPPRFPVDDDAPDAGTPVDTTPPRRAARAASTSSSAPAHVSGMMKTAKISKIFLNSFIYQIHDSKILKIGASIKIQKFMVRARRLELPRICIHHHLKVARLPVPPYSHNWVKTPQNEIYA